MSAKKSLLSSVTDVISNQNVKVDETQRSTAEFRLKYGELDILDQIDAYIAKRYVTPDATSIIMQDQAAAYEYYRTSIMDLASNLRRNDRDVTQEIFRLIHQAILMKHCHDNLSQGVGKLSSGSERPAPTIPDIKEDFSELKMKVMEAKQPVVDLNLKISDDVMDFIGDVGLDEETMNFIRDVPIDPDFYNLEKMGGPIVIEDPSKKLVLPNNEEVKNYASTRGGTNGLDKNDDGLVKGSGCRPTKRGRSST